MKWKKRQQEKKTREQTQKKNDELFLRTPAFWKQINKIESKYFIFRLYLIYLVASKA